MPNSNSHALTEAAVCCLVAIVLIGCGGEDRYPTVPVEGKVLYRGAPLAFGSVVFYPEKGPPARGDIGPDGTFRLSTYRQHDGAIVGRHRVEIKCYENQRPGSAPITPAPGEETDPLGKPLIPTEYMSYTSKLQADVKAERNDPFEFDLK